MKCESSVSKFLQFLVLSFFTYSVFLWYGGLLLILLSLWVTLNDFLGEHILGMTLSIPVSFLVIALFCAYIADKTRFFTVAMDVGRELICLAIRSVARISGHDAKSSHS